MDQLVDELARLAGGSLPRRRMLRLAAGLMVGAILAPKPEPVQADVCTSFCPTGACTDGSPCCCDPILGLAGCCVGGTCCGIAGKSLGCCKDPTPNCCGGACCAGSCCGTTCCAVGQNCCGTTCCGADQSCCGTTCCAAGQACSDGQCRTPCPSGTVECQGSCVPQCEPGLTLDSTTCQCECGGETSPSGPTGSARPASVCCPKGQTPCGPSCCTLGSTCADPRTGLCCAPGFSRCGVGCCGTGQRCVKPGTPDSPPVCGCPGLGVACGDFCFTPKAGRCCPAAEGGKPFPCANGLICCGDGCCCPKNSTCLIAGDGRCHCLKGVTASETMTASPGA